MNIRVRPECIFLFKTNQASWLDKLWIFLFRRGRNIGDGLVQFWWGCCSWTCEGIRRKGNTFSVIGMCIWLKKELEEHKNMCEKLIGEIDEVFFFTVPEADV